jgi:CelD/BcsL family acetyltransferase involved in cellulose biosynthesis
MSSVAFAEKETLRAEMLCDLEALLALRQEWRALWERCPDATPFQSDAWLLPWCRAYHPARLLAWSFRVGLRLVALAPFYLCEEDGRCRVLLLGTGNTDYLDLLSEPAHAAAAAAQALAVLAQETGWESIDLRQLRPGSPLLAAPLPAGLEDEIVAGEACPVLALEQRATRLDAMRRRAAQERRRLARRAPVAVVHADPLNTGEILEALVTLHAQRWRERGMPGVLSAERERAFHREVCHAMFRAGMLRLAALRCGGDIIAVHYGFSAKGRSFSYLGGFDRAFATYSPGLQLLAEAIEQAVAEDAQCFDFLRGREGYKYRWGAVDQPTWQRRIGRP